MSLSTTLDPPEGESILASRLRIILRAIESHDAVPSEDSPKGYPHPPSQLAGQPLADTRDSAKPFADRRMLEIVDELEDLIKFRGFFGTLRDLSKCDFRQKMALVDLCDILSMENWPPIPLVVRHTIPLEVIIDPQAFDPSQIAPIANSSVEGDPTPGDAVHPCFFALSLLEPNPKPASASSSSSQPKYILPLGRLVEHWHLLQSSEGGQGSNHQDKPYEETGYVVVIDVLSRDRAVWIVFNDSQMGDMGERISVDYADLQKPFPHIKEDFAIAKITPSLEDWVNRRLRVEDVLRDIKESMRFGIPKLRMVTEKEVLTALE